MILQSLKEAKEQQKTIQVRFLKVLLTGSAGAGKTSFSHLLLKQPIKETHESTNLACASHAVSIQKAVIPNAPATKSDDITWVKLNPELEIHFLRSLLVPSSSSTVTENQNNLVVENSPHSADDEDHKSTFIQKSVHYFWYLVGFIGWLAWVIPSFFEANNPVQVPKSTFKLILHDSLIPNPNKFVPMPGKILNIITLLDTGGQPQYIHLLPTINIRPTVTFVVHNLSKNLTDPVLVEYNQNGEQIVTPYSLSYTYLDMIKLLISATNDSEDRDTSYAQELNLNTTKGANNNSWLCLVGTHNDKVDEEVRKSTETKLTSLVHNMESKAAVWHNEESAVLFAADNTTAGSKKEDPIANIIRHKIETVAEDRDVYDVPIVWMLLELEIRKFCDLNNKAYISFDQCVKLAKDSGLMYSDVEVKKALIYHHSLGVLLYFDNSGGFSDYVITDHQWWFEKMSKIVCLTLQENHDYLDYHAFKKLKFEGILSKNLLDFIEWNDDIKKEHFLLLLDRLKIIAELDINGTYFIPYVLPSYKPQEYDISNQYGNIQGEPLLVQFCSGILPRGFFCTLIVQLLQSKVWEIHSCKDSKEVHHVFINLISFNLLDGYSLSLFDKVDYLELQIRQKEERFQNSAHYNAYENLDRHLAKVCKHLNLAFNNIRYGFMCSCNESEEDHIAFLPKRISSAKSATCSIDSIHTLKMTKSHMSWFSQDGMYVCSHIQ